jgi:hypothetical protein
MIDIWLEMWKLLLLVNIVFYYVCVRSDNLFLEASTEDWLCGVSKTLHESWHNVHILDIMSLSCFYIFEGVAIGITEYIKGCSQFIDNHKKIYSW